MIWPTFKNTIDKHDRNAFRSSHDDRRPEPVEGRREGYGGGRSARKSERGERQDSVQSGPQEVGHGGMRQ